MSQRSVFCGLVKKMNIFYGLKIMVLQKKNDSNYVSGSASGLGSADGGGDASKTDDADVNAVNSNDNMTDRNL